MIEFRTYETHAIVWSRVDESGPYESRWSGYQTAEEAQAVIDRGVTPGRVETTSFEVRIEPTRATMYQPGVSSRFVDEAGDPVATEVLGTRIEVGA